MCVTVIIQQSVAFAPGRNTLFLYCVQSELKLNTCTVTRLDLGCDGAGCGQIYTRCGIHIRLC